MTGVLAVAAATWGVAMALSPLLQIRQMVRTKSSQDVSIAYFAVLIVGFALWLAYGIALDNMALVIPNAVAFVVASITVFVSRSDRRDP